MNVLPPPQQLLWAELSQVPPYFALYGGTALALRLGHRQSVDFDLFGFCDITQSQLVASIPFLSNCETTQQAANTMSVLVDRGGPVSVSFFGLPRLFALEEPDRAPDNGLNIASLLDLAATKMSVVQVRAEAKDYLDIHALIMLAGIDLPVALGAACALYGKLFNPQVTLKALSYFDDGDVRLLSTDVKSQLAGAARAVDLNHLPTIEPK